ncbi:MAG: 6-carboxytetrahydropterin synthase, partial [Candidatus Mariimomonas ferrooxydans]
MIEAQFSSAHKLRGYKGKCENLHGHNWKVQVMVSSEKLNETGLVIDFDEFKKTVEELLSTLDHFVLNESPHYLNHHS